jgi:hypothetical protein
VGRVIVDTLALKFLTPVAGLVAAAPDFAYLAQCAAEVERGEQGANFQERRPTRPFGHISPVCGAETPGLH